MGNNSEIMNSKNNIIENYSKYEEKLKENGYNTKLVTENGEKYLVVYEKYITYKFNKLNSCIAEFSNKDVAEQKYTCTMYTKNIGESNINVTLHETYQNSVLDFSCNYSPMILIPLLQILQTMIKTTERLKNSLKMTINYP